MKGKVNKESFTAMTDSRSPITIFTQADLRKIRKLDVIFPARPMLINDKYVDYNNQPLNLAGFITADLQWGGRTSKTQG